MYCVCLYAIDEIIKDFREFFNENEYEKVVLKLKKIYTSSYKLQSSNCVIMLNF